jgi:tellurite resistance protein TehA-like permease
VREGRRGRASAVAGLVALSLALCLLPASASAYIDPGTGSYVFQTVVAALITAGFLLRSFWHRVVGVFRRRTPAEKVDPTKPTE